MRWLVLTACAGALAAADWTEGPTLPATLVGPVLALPDGGVFAVCGDPNDSSAPEQAWRLDGARSSWRQVGALPAPIGASATVLSTGIVMFAGGGDGGTGPKSGAVWLYDLSTDAWTQGAPLTVPRSRHVLLPLASGGAFAYGGLRDYRDFPQPGPDPYYAIYDTPPESLLAGAWHAQPVPYPSAMDALAVILPDGWSVVSEGDPGPNSGATFLGPTMLVPPDGSALVPTWNAPAGIGEPVLAPLADGGVLFIGGVPFGAPWPGTRDVAILERQTATWTAGPQTIDDIHGGGAALLGDGHVLLAYNDVDTLQAKMEEFDPSTLRWSMVEPPPYGAPLVLADGTLLSMVSGGVALRAPDQPAALDARFSSSAAYVTRADPLHAHLRFDRPVSGLTASSFTTDNVTALALSGSDADYDLAITGASDGMLTVTLPAGSVRDSAGHQNAQVALRRMVDRQAPIVAIGDGTVDPYPYVDWHLTVTGAERLDPSAADVQVRFTGTLTGRVNASPHDIALIGLAGSGSVSISLAAGVAADAAGNASASTSWTTPIEVDCPPATTGGGTASEGGGSGAGTAVPATTASASGGGNHCGAGSVIALMIGIAFACRRQRS